MSVYLITALIYAALAGIAWSHRASGQTANGNRATGGKAREVRFAARAGVGAALALHAWLLCAALFSNRGTNLSLGVALSLIAWLITAIYWIESFWYPVGALQRLILPYAGMPLFVLHLVVSLLAYGLITIAAMHALLAWLFESRLHSGSLPAFMRELPPLVEFERLTFRILTAGFVLLSLTVFSGMVFSEAVFGRPWQSTPHKIVFGIVAWAVFAMLIAGRRLRGWRGRVALRWTMAGFGFLLLAYVGSKFVLEVILHRT